MAYSLEEHAESYVIPTEVEIKTELIAWRDVTDAFKVTMIFQSTVSDSDLTVTVNINELKVTGICLEVITVLMIGIFSSIVCLCI